MKAHLLHAGRDADLEQPLPPHAGDLEQDLELATLLDGMARGDEYLRECARRTLHAPLADPEEILYRQGILRDCLELPELACSLYDLAVAGVETKKRTYAFWYRDSPDSILHKSLVLLTDLLGLLRELRKLADEHAAEVRSDGFGRLFATIQAELGDEYLDTVGETLRELRFGGGALISASLGRANRGTDYVLRKPRKRGLVERLTPGGPDSYSFTVAHRDEAGLNAVAELRNRGINRAADAVAQAADHVLDFFARLRAELGFYVGCANLLEQLAERNEPTTFPEPAASAPRTYAVRGLYDAALSFHLDQPVVGNDVEAGGRRLVIVTGANQGGKSTFLRSVGLAQLMMQAGMFVPAESFRASVCNGVFTHFKREEDATMTHGKLDEELGRMSRIADAITPASLVLCNESFAATNEREGSEIARQVIGALVDSDVTVVFVTHLFELADTLHGEGRDDALFLRAERRDDGRRTFRVLPGKPLPTSYGADSYLRVFGRPVSRQATRTTPARRLR
jgi:hypothetical protein